MGEIMFNDYQIIPANRLPRSVHVRNTFGSVFTIKRPKGANAPRARDVLMTNVF